MVIAGKIRSNAPQLASYLLAQGTNERITIMDVDGSTNADEADLKDMLYSMELNSELTRSRNSVYHAYINPAPDDTTDRAMTMEEWQKSVEILTKQLGYEDQRRVVVLHEKPGNRVHAHIVYERYNHERGVMATYAHNYNAHDKARAEMESALSHKPTPQKNKNRDHHKQTLTEIWQRTKTAAEFINEADANGYKIAKGIDRPFRVIDANGVSFDLVRKLDGIKTKQVKARFAETELIPEKQGIRENQAAKQQSLQAAKSEEKPPVIKKQDKFINQPNYSPLIFSIMKEENNAATAPTESQMNDMYGNAWLDYHADAQQAKQDVNRRYAKMVNTFGSYKQMPDGVKEILKQDYAAHEARWGENGTEMQKRFGTNESDAKVELTHNAAQITTDEHAQKKQDFLQKIQEQRNRQKTQTMEYEP